MSKTYFELTNKLNCQHREKTHNQLQSSYHLQILGRVKVLRLIPVERHVTTSGSDITQV